MRDGSTHEADFNSSFFSANCSCNLDCSVSNWIVYRCKNEMFYNRKAEFIYNHNDSPLQLTRIASGFRLEAFVPGCRNTVEGQSFPGAKFSFSEKSEREKRRKLVSIIIKPPSHISKIDICLISSTSLSLQDL